MGKVKIVTIVMIFLGLSVNAQTATAKNGDLSTNNEAIISEKMTEESLERKLYEFLNNNKDPFDTNYNNPDISSSGGVSSGGTGLPPGIEIKGIIVTKEGDKNIALQLPGYSLPVVMQVNESVRLSREQLANAGIKRSTDIYVRIIGVDKSGVKIIQERRPDQVIILK